MVRILLAVMVATAAFAADKAPRTLQVTGTAETAVRPDICYVTFGVETRHKKSAGEAYRANATLVNLVIAAIKEQGIAAKDIQSTGLQVNPQYIYEEESRNRRFDGYLVQHAVAVSVRDIDKVSGVLDAGIGAGANEVNGVRFAVENPKRYTAGVREEAVRAAKDKARTMADLLDVKLGKPLSVSEHEPGGWNQPYAQSNVMMARGEGGAGESMNFEPGEVKLSRTVNITFEILE
ncbi:MAG: SIMPL domain-containing protein [bacterium]